MHDARRRSARRILTLAAGLGAALAVSGCAKPAISVDDERSQFDRYDQTRNQRAAPYLYDEFGRRRPNLRGRLLVRE